MTDSGAPPQFIPATHPDDSFDRAERRFRRTLALGLAVALVLGIVIVILLLLQCLEAGAVAGLVR